MAENEGKSKGSMQFNTIGADSSRFSINWWYYGMAGAGVGGGADTISY